MITLFIHTDGPGKCVSHSGQDAINCISGLISDTAICWVDLQAATEQEIECVFQRFLPVHPLTLEDITRQRRDPQSQPHLPKVEEFSDYLFIIVNPLITTAWPEHGDDAALTTQLAAVLTHQRLITFHESPVPAIDGLHRYLERHAAQSNRGPDFLFHLILDQMVDEYAPLLDTMTERIDGLEEAIFDGAASKELLPHLLHVKRKLTIIRKTLIYEREVLARMCRGDFELISDQETTFYRNVYDHLVRFTELTEGSREMVADLLQTQQAVVSNRLNEVMKALTMVSTVVLPMTVVAGIYGMNFLEMPEIKWPWGYYWALSLMVLVGLAPLAWFRWKRWL